MTTALRMNKYVCMYNERSYENLMSRKSLEKEEDLYDRLINIEQSLKIIEIEYEKRYSSLSKRKLKSLLIKKYYRELEAIDDLFAKTNYLDPANSNFMMNEIDERLNKLKDQIRSSSFFIFAASE